METKNDNVIEYLHRVIRSIEQKAAAISIYQSQTTIKHATKIKHKFLRKEIPEEIPLSTKIGMCIKKLKKYDTEYEKDEKVDYYYDEVCPMPYSTDRYCCYRMMRNYGRQLFVFMKTIIIHPGESLYFSLKEDSNYPINGIVNKDCIQFKIKAKIIYKKGVSKGTPYIILTEKSNKGLEKTKELVELYDIDFSKRDIDRVSNNVIIKITNKLDVDLMIKGKDKIEEDHAKPYEFWIYLEKTDSIEYRKKLMSKAFQGRPHIIPPEECKIRPNKIEKLSKRGEH